MKTKIMLILCALMLMVSGCTQSNKPEEPKKEVETVAEETKTEEKEEQELDKDPITGLGIVSKDDIQFAKSFEITRLEDGYILVDLGSGDEVFVLVPKDKEMLDIEDVLQIHYPAENMGVYSTTHVALLKAIGHLDKIGSVNNDIDSWYIEDVPELMESGKIIFVGQSTNVDYEIIQASNPEVVLDTGANTEAHDKMREKLKELGIPTIRIFQNVEDDPRGRIEWAKVFGAIVGDDEAANAYFDDQIARIDKIIGDSESNEEKPTIVNFRGSDKGFTIKKADDYSVEMLRMAGGEYGLDGKAESGNGTMKISAEEFYTMDENVDVLIHENMGAQIDTVDKLAQFGDYLKDLKAVKEGRIYTTNPNYWQSMDKTAEMIEELNMIINGTAPDEMVYYKKMK